MYFLNRARDLYLQDIPKTLSPAYYDIVEPSQKVGFDAITPSIDYSLGDHPDLNSLNTVLSD